MQIYLIMYLPISILLSALSMIILKKSDKKENSTNRFGKLDFLLNKLNESNPSIGKFVKFVVTEALEGNLLTTYSLLLLIHLIPLLRFIFFFKIVKGVLTKNTASI